MELVLPHLEWVSLTLALSIVASIWSVGLVDYASTLFGLVRRHYLASCSSVGTVHLHLECVIVSEGAWTLQILKSSLILPKFEGVVQTRHMVLNRSHQLLWLVISFKSGWVPHSHCCIEECLLFREVSLVGGASESGAWTLAKHIFH